MWKVIRMDVLMCSCVCNAALIFHYRTVDGMCGCMYVLKAIWMGGVDVGLIGTNV